MALSRAAEAKQVLDPDVTRPEVLARSGQSSCLRKFMVEEPQGGKRAPSREEVKESADK